MRWSIFVKALFWVIVLAAGTFVGLMITFILLGIGMWVQ